MGRGMGGYAERLVHKGGGSGRGSCSFRLSSSLWLP